MAAPDALRLTRIPLAHGAPSGAGAMPALGFGTLIPDPVVTAQATKAALEAGFRYHLVKPVDARDLTTAIARCAVSRQARR